MPPTGRFAPRACKIPLAPFQKLARLCYNSLDMNLPDADSKIFRRTLLEEAKKSGITPKMTELDAFCAHYGLLRKWNPRARLTAAIEPRRAALELFVDSLIACRFAEKAGIAATGRDSAENAFRMIDIGSGGGFPGVVAKVMHPEWELTLVDSNTKKVSFLKFLTLELGLAGTHTVCGRAEKLAHRDEYRGGFDLAFCRAVADPPAAIELTAAFLKIGGLFVMQTSPPETGKRRKRTFGEVPESAGAVGVTLGSSTTYDLSGATARRTLVEIRKTGPTPTDLPRDYRAIRKKPIK